MTKGNNNEHIFRKHGKKFTEMKYRSYVEFQRRFSVTVVHNSHLNSWKNSQKYWKPQDNC